MAVILIIDDNPESCEIAQELLEDGGHQVFVSTDWIKGTAMVHRHRPDLLMVDVRMPNIEGPQGLQLLRQFTLKKLPKVVFFSGVDESELRNLVKLHSADGFIQKGKIVEMLERINKILDAEDGPKADENKLKADEDQGKP